jgi:hypothetical protein
MHFVPIPIGDHNRHMRHDGYVLVFDPVDEQYLMARESYPDECHWPSLRPYSLTLISYRLGASLQDFAGQAVLEQAIALDRNVIPGTSGKKALIPSR